MIRRDLVMNDLIAIGKSATRDDAAHSYMTRAIREDEVFSRDRLAVEIPAPEPTTWILMGSASAILTIRRFRAGRS
jgi:hypothetical protein